VESRIINCAWRFGPPRLVAAFTFSALLVQLLLASPFSTKAAEPAPKKLHVVTTIFPIYCFASGVIGSEGDVQNLLPPNIEPHDYQLSPSDLRKIKQADVVIMNGLGLDNWVMKALEPNKNRRVISLGSLLNKTNLIDLAADLDLEGEHKHGHEHQHAAFNPHIWLDPQLAIDCVNIISNAVAGQNPACKKNAEAYVARLKQLDSDLATQLAPVRNRAFITQHDAFPYFVRRYELKQVGVIEVTPDVSPSPRYLSDLLKVIREKNVPVIFTDPRASQRLAKQIAKDAKIHTADLDTLESGKLDPQGYEQGMRRNAATLARELK
jgi:zinc/manganese transport system substrate-binding protein